MSRPQPKTFSLYLALNMLGVLMESLAFLTWGSTEIDLYLEPVSSGYQSAYLFFYQSLSKKGTMYIFTFFFFFFFF